MLQNNHYVLIRPDGLIETKEFDVQTEDVNDVIHAALDGSFYEIVRIRNIGNKYIMLVDDEGVLKHLRLNPVASELYGIRIHGCPIVGNAVIMREDLVDGEPDIVGLTDDDLAEFIHKLRGLVVLQEVEE